jgi:hypothetical protein
MSSPEDQRTPMPGKSRAAKGSGDAHLWMGVANSLCPPMDEKSTAEAADTIFRKLTAGKTPAAKGVSPHLVLTMGPPGAGKSTVALDLVRHCSDTPPDKYVVLDHDSVLDLLPVGEKIRHMPDVTGARASGVGAAYGWSVCLDVVGAAAQRVYRRLVDAKYSIILHSHNPEDLVDAQCGGYVCTVLYVVVTPEKAISRAAARAPAEGRFLWPASAENAFGWDRVVPNLWRRYVRMAAWFSLWADNIAIVNNQQDNKTFAKSDFQLYETHTPPGSAAEWWAPVHALVAEIMRAHAAAEQMAAAEKPKKK